MRETGLTAKSTDSIFGARTHTTFPKVERLVMFADRPTRPSVPGLGWKRMAREDRSSGTWPGGGAGAGPHRVCGRYLILQDPPKHTPGQETLGGGRQAVDRAVVIQLLQRHSHPQNLVNLADTQSLLKRPMHGRGAWQKAQQVHGFTEKSLTRHDSGDSHV